MIIHVVAQRYEALDPLGGVKNEALECHGYPLGGVEIFLITNAPKSVKN